MSDHEDDDRPGGQSGEVWDRHADHILAASAAAVLAIGTVAFRLLEDWSWVDAFYFSVIAATTVGFGDLSPTSDASKLFSVLYIASGLSIIAVFLNERLKRHAIRVKKRRH